jgi:hypothetical protein
MAQISCWHVTPLVAAGFATHFGPRPSFGFHFTLSPNLITRPFATELDQTV